MSDVGLRVGFNFITSMVYFIRFKTLYSISSVLPPTMKKQNSSLRPRPESTYFLLSQPRSLFSGTLPSVPEAHLKVPLLTFTTLSSLV